MSSIAPQPADAAPPWRHVLGADLAAHAQDPAAMFVQVASLDAEHRPSVRSMSFRRFGPNGELVFVTDTRSAKVAALNADGWGEACWYFPDARVQWRLAGQVAVHGGAAPADWSALRASLWRAGSDEARRRFQWPAPGQLRAPAAAFVTAPPPLVPPAHFALFVLAAQRVERLCLRSSPHARRSWAQAGTSWAVTDVNP
ncbi:pyridoxamine 5'-phosphate oxidase family protein [Niveibacterium sp. 24ML]|uniref:pyridoxamine 5'-phosphate oxidase family protein n=1 Tax=Niveibacterium sp. 24ML TaxID=2985512 RepID=UPI00226F4CF1|nr:pyridoxamine 5'-phosphate oxidase family protein [Niveibacterium sp. 24ML]MCX9157871.1 pyridoxamine 5'-phosphate oxidase family protein [Niveibacterium sp. 24ML]